MRYFNYIFMLKLNKIKSFAILAACTATFMFGTYSAAHADTNIAVADTSRIMETSLAYKDILKQLEKKYDAYRESIQKSEAQLKKKYQEIEAQKSALSKEVFEAKSEELEKDANDLRRRSYNERNILEKAQIDSLQKLNDKILEIIQTKAKNVGYTLIIEKNATPYSDDKLDLTSAILEDLDKALPTIQVDFEAARKGAEAVEENAKGAAKANNTNTDNAKAKTSAPEKEKK